MVLISIICNAKKQGPPVKSDVPLRSSLWFQDEVTAMKTLPFVAILRNNQRILFKDVQLKIQSRSTGKLLSTSIFSHFLY